MVTNEFNPRQADDEAPDIGAPQFLPRWVLSNRIAAGALAAAAGLAITSTWLMLSPAVEELSPRLLTGLFIGNVIIAAGFIVLVGLRLWDVWTGRRHRLAGARTHTQLVGLFALVALAPSLIAFLFAFTILRTSLNDVFSDRIERYHNTARGLANTLVDSIASELKLAMQQIAYDIVRNEQAGIGLEATPISFRQYLYLQAEVRGLAALYLVSGDGRLLVRAELQDAVYALPPKEKLDELNRNAPGEKYVFGANDEATYDMFRGVVSLPFYGNGYLIAYQPAPPEITQQLFKVRALKSDWNDAERGRKRAENVFTAGYLFIAVIILSGAVWLALWAATRFVRPIGRLIRMADKVSAGELGARVDVHKNDGELGALARSMNRMTAQLQTQRDDLIETNRQFDRRRRFTEAVLSGVSAGVVGVSAEGRITIVNRFAADLLGVDGSRLVGARFAEANPELQCALNAAAEGSEAAAQIEIERGGKRRTVNVKIVADEVEGEKSFVVTFDDITQLIAAQRDAAWGDVARRIAHEIKNPLTPIQLSAERLRRKYFQEITTAPEVFDRCTETIIRHVNDIGRMVDEFSSFARMPKPVIATEDLRELARAAIFPQKVAFPDVEFALSAPERPVVAACDGRMIVQALSNILKNGAESIGARLAAGGDRSPGRVRVAVAAADGAARIEVTDNGAGLPPERHRMTEPYMTTRAKGTGLGLAIVKKVIEEHGGALEFHDDATLGGCGARVSIVLPIDDAERTPGRAAAAAE